MKRRDEIDEREVEELVGRLGDETPALPEEELRALARSAATAEASRQPARLHRRLRLRWAVAAAVVALFLGSGLGFGIASSLTPSGRATDEHVGLGVLPAPGWNVVQSGTATPAGTAQTVAANVRLKPTDGAGIPYATLASLPSHGVLISVTFTVRGDPLSDTSFPDSELPLQITASRPESAGELLPLPSRLAQHRLRAGVRGFNVDARIFYGTAPPSQEMQGAAQDQLERLVVASERVTIFARPTIIAWGQSATIFGAVENGRRGEHVDIQVKECGGHFFRGITATDTGDGGAWTGQVAAGVTAGFRAVWNGFESEPVVVQQRVGVLLDQKLGREYRVAVVGRAQFWRKRAVIQLRRQGAWRTVRSVVLTDTAGGGGYVWSSGTFKASFPRESLIRAVFPPAQARPCLLGGVSNSLRTR